ncbi:MFS transporter [Rivihabitans pingtungensis]|uniref:Putative MFS family arabinose efflux permease n=1 Tax=Rivihabitans pingtungensis TaxID=1054498 RepID=A0A318KKE7_9NEIS|nr:MFS transporter [Rivihabitans pingtungensis]PXX77930.1 putative MFS family arabinose efflux permease [Rivihabitans pingtungensis]
MTTLPPTVWLLALSQALAMTVVSLTLSASAWVGSKLAGPDWATLPLAAQYLATLLLLSPVAWAMTRLGRRPVLAAGALLGMLGLALAALAIARQQFAWFVAASGLVGAFNAVAQYYRFVAADVAPPGQHGRAIAATLTGGVLAAWLGPALASHTRLLGPQPFTVSFVWLAVLAGLAALCALVMRIPPGALPASGARRPWRTHARNPRLWLAVLAASSGYALMNLLMTATPLAMRCAQFDFAAAATVIQWHIVAMFAPSLLSGRLVQRLGAPGVMLGGAVLMLASVGISLRGETFGHFQWALALLGVGWNGVYVGASSLLTECCWPAEKAWIQAGNDSMVFLGVTLMTAAAAPAVNAWGWMTLNQLALAPLLLLAGACGWLYWRPPA